MKNPVKFKTAINLALQRALKKDKDILLMGLGVGDPKNIFETTTGLQEKFGKKRVFDVPCSENALTGICVGYGLKKKAILTHQRFDFMLLSFDQIINNAAKIHFMYGGNLQSNITIRAIVGKGWGQGPTHSQNFQAMLGSVPGLKVYFPFNSNDVFNILYHSIFDPNPVIIIEHRWLYELESKIKFQKKIKSVEKVSSGNKGTIVCIGNTVLDAYILKKTFSQKKIKFDIIKILSINPLKVNMIINSVKKTKNLILLEPTHKSMSVSSEILARVHTSGVFFRSKIISNEEMSVPTSFYLSDKVYPQIKKTVKIICNFLSINSNFDTSKYSQKLHDIPNKNFRGPF